MQALVVDDSKAMRMLLGRFLKKFGFEVFEAQDGQDGLDRLSQLVGLNLVLVDWNMPRMNGIEVVRAVRSQKAYDGLILMMVTTETEMDKMVSALEAGANEYVMKPFTEEVILEKLNLLGIGSS